MGIIVVKNEYGYKDIIISILIAFMLPINFIVIMYFNAGSVFMFIMSGEIHIYTIIAFIIVLLITALFKYHNIKTKSKNSKICYIAGLITLILAVVSHIGFYLVYYI